jgi:hypothetical protein
MKMTRIWDENNEALLPHILRLDVLWPHFSRIV